MLRFVSFWTFLRNCGKHGAEIVLNLMAFVRACVSRACVDGQYSSYAHFLPSFPPFEPYKMYPQD